MHKIYPPAGAIVTFVWVAGQPDLNSRENAQDLNSRPLRTTAQTMEEGPERPSRPAPTLVLRQLLCQSDEQYVATITHPLPAKPGPIWHLQGESARELRVGEWCCCACYPGGATETKRGLHTLDGRPRYTSDGEQLADMGRAIGVPVQPRVGRKRANEAARAEDGDDGEW